MTVQLLALVDWFNTASPAITAALGGSFAMASACLLFMIATALGPDVAVFQCISPRARFFAKLTAFAWFVRGSLVLTTMTGPDARHPHWDMPVSWGMTTILLVYLLAYLWSQRMPAGVRLRFDRREAFRRERVRALVAAGQVPEAKLAADGHDAAGQFYDLGLAPETVARLRARP